MFVIPKKFNLPAMKHPFYFVVLSVVLAASSWLLLLENFKTYRTEITLLVLPQSERVIMQSAQVVENLAELPRQLAFYDKMQASGKINDPYLGKSQDQRKKLWNKSLSIERTEKGAVIMLSVVSAQRSDALATAKQAVNTLLAQAGYYYDIKEDLTVRVIDGPITAPQVKNLPWLAVVSLVLGVTAAYLINAALEKILTFSVKTTSNIAPKKDFFRTEKSQEKNAPVFGKNVFYFKRPVATAKQHGAPANLPIATGEYPFAMNSVTEPEMAASEEIAMTMEREATDADASAQGALKAEPTEEELKKRLNQLLGGEI